LERGVLRKMRSESAVSPVIGVMLMLVVTVLLAAAVSSFTGALQAQKPAPTANFDVKIVKNETTSMGYKCTYMQITEVSGDRIPTKDLEIITYNPDAYGPHKTMVVKPNSMNTHFLFYGHWINGTSPYYNHVVKKDGYIYLFGEVLYANWTYYKTGDPPFDFGNYTITPGVTMTADWYSNYPQAPWNKNGYYSGANVTGFCACIADGWNVTPGHYITVKIVYTPTHTVIWEKKVLVEGEGI